MVEGWREGRFVPLSVAFLALVLIGYQISYTVHRMHTWRYEHFGFVNTESVILVVGMVLALLTAAGRKLTLTKNTLVVRKLFGLWRTVVPLNDVVSVVQRGISPGTPSPWQPVFIELTSGRTITTQSLGANAGAGIHAVKQAATTAGGSLEAVR